MGAAALRWCHSGRRLLRHGLASSRPPPRPPLPGIEPAASSSAMARPHRLPLRPPLPGAEPTTSSSAMDRPRRPSPPPPWPGCVPAAPPPPRPECVPSASSSAAVAAGQRDLPRGQASPQATGSHITAEEGSAPRGRWSTVGPDGFDGSSGLAVPQAGPTRHEGH
jgi:hypothetical protein